MTHRMGRAMALLAALLAPLHRADAQTQAQAQAQTQAQPRSTTHASHWSWRRASRWPTTGTSERAKLPDFFDAVRAAVQQHQPKHLVLDLRLNGGGDLTQARDFAESLPTSERPVPPVLDRRR